MLVRKTERTADAIFSASSNFITGGSDEWDSFDRVCPRSHNRPRGLFRRTHSGDDREDPASLFRAEEADQGDLSRPGESGV